MSNSVKIVVHVPIESTKDVVKAMGDAGAGRIGNYSHCSFTVRGTGSNLPEAGASPTIGAVGKIEFIPEDRVEMTCDRQYVEDVIRAIRRVHPYEEPTFDVYERLDY